LGFRIIFGFGAYASFVFDVMARFDALWNIQRRILFVVESAYHEICVSPLLPVCLEECLGTNATRCERPGLFVPLRSLHTYLHAPRVASPHKIIVSPGHCNRITHIIAQPLRLIDGEHHHWFRLKHRRGCVQHIKTQPFNSTATFVGHRNLQLTSSSRPLRGQEHRKTEESAVPSGPSSRG
jgi:hypothetical protein